MADAALDSRHPSKSSATPGTQPSEAPYPGSHQMPQWEVGELIAPPVFRWRALPLLLGPGLVMGASAIGGGEWLTGPLLTARYGGALLWMATLSILGQVLYNIEISRYTLYCGEPILTGKFRLLPGPRFWPFLYLALDLGSFLPYLISNAAIPLATIYLGRLPDPKAEAPLLKAMACGLFIVVLLPLIFGGKIYRSLKILMSIKLILLMSFLLFLAIGYSTASTWYEIFSGFFRFGTLPVQSGDGSPKVANVLAAWWHGQTLPPLDLSMLGVVTAMAAIAGNGGLTNMPISNFTRDQGWGMGHGVGAIPSMFGRHSISLSHVGKVFLLNPLSLERWKGWMRHMSRDQLLVWMPACFLGMALPSMLSMQFLPRGTVLKDNWLAASMTADGVSGAVGPTLGPTFWYLTLLCGFLVLGTSGVMTADGVLRRWVDVCWTASSRMRTWAPSDIGKFYFAALCAYTAFGMVMLIFVKGDDLLTWSTTIYNCALGFSCWHVLAANLILLPRDLRPGWGRRIGLVVAGSFFMGMAVLTAMHKLYWEIHA